MTVDKDTVTYLSKLAKLNIKADEMDEVTSQLEKILGYMESLKAVEPTGGEPESVLALRDDVVKPSADKNELLANCAERTFFAPVVPKVVE